LPCTASDGVRPLSARQSGSASKPEHSQHRHLSELSDQELLDGIRRASEAHFSELYGRYFQRIYSFVYTRIRNHADAEEVVQETFTAVFRSFDSYRGQSSLLSWIYGIAKNTVNSQLRRAKSQGQGLERAENEQLAPGLFSENSTPEQHLGMQRYAEAIRRELGEVAEWQSEVFVMRHLENLSIAEISRRTQRSSDSIRSSLYRVKRLLIETAEETATPVP
jgi:RNA polymerase sigma-70 factor (ECF subfamily)